VQGDGADSYLIETLDIHSHLQIRQQKVKPPSKTFLPFERSIEIDPSRTFVTDSQKIRQIQAYDTDSNGAVRSPFILGFINILHTYMYDDNV
jgi:hypothetical protein